MSYASKAIVTALFLIYSLILVLVFKYLGHGFVTFSSLSKTDFFSMAIFLLVTIISLFNINYFALFLPFVLLSMPMAADNFFPQILASSSYDFSKTYLSTLSRIDVFLIAGTIRYLNPRDIQINKYYLITLSLIVLLFVSTMVSFINETDPHTRLIVITQSYHFRYFSLLMLLALNTSILGKDTYLFYGIIFSLIFIVSESFLSTHLLQYSRLTSGSLGNNSYANILAAFYGFYVIKFRKNKLSVTFNLISVIFLFLIFKTQTRSAFFLYVLVTYSNLIYSFFSVPVKKRKNIIILSLLFTSIFFTILNESPRYNFFDSKEIKIDINKSGLNHKLNLDQTEFNKSLIMRLNHFQTSLNMIKSNPITGIGAGMWNYKKKQYGSEDKRFLDSHNDFLSAMSQYGLLTGFLLCILIYFLPIILKIHSRNLKLKNASLKYLYVFSVFSFFVGITNSGLFKYSIFSFMSLILMIYIYRTTTQKQ